MTPILMTAATTGLALLPLVFFGERAGQEIVRPMAIVILGGLITSTLLNLFVVPGLRNRDSDGLSDDQEKGRSTLRLRRWWVACWLSL